MEFTPNPLQLAKEFQTDTEFTQWLMIMEEEDLINCLEDFQDHQELDLYCVLLREELKRRNTEFYR